MVLSLRREGQKVEESRGPRVKASEAGPSGDKMDWVLSVLSNSMGEARTEGTARQAQGDGTTALTLQRLFCAGLIFKERTAGARPFA